MKKKVRFIILAVLIYSMVSSLLFGGVWLLGHYLQPEVPDWLGRIIALAPTVAAIFVLGYLAGSKLSHR